MLEGFVLATWTSFTSGGCIEKLQAIYNSTTFQIIGSFGISSTRFKL